MKAKKLKRKSNAPKIKALKASKRSYPKNAESVLVNQKMLYKVRDQLKSHSNAIAFGVKSSFKKIDVRFIELEAKFENRFQAIDAKFQAIDARFDQLEAKYDAKFQAIDAKFQAIDARFDQLEAKYDAKFQAIDARFDQLDSKIETLRSEVARMAVLVEEQNRRNAIVLDALSSLFERQGRLEKRMDDLESKV